MTGAAVFTAYSEIRSNAEIVSHNFVGRIVAKAPKRPMFQP
jgi:hypothetical protein